MYSLKFNSRGRQIFGRGAWGGSLPPTTIAGSATGLTALEIFDSLLIIDLLRWWSQLSRPSSLTGHSTCPTGHVEMGRVMATIRYHSAGGTETSKWLEGGKQENSSIIESPIM